jgi:putative transposase
MSRRWTFRCYPTPEQEQVLSRTFGCVRYVYNWGLQQRTAAFRAGQRMDYVKSSAALTHLKAQPEMVWLNEVSSVPLQQALRHLQTAFLGFFEKRTAYPTFHKRGRKDTAEYTKSGFRFDLGNHRLLLAKMGAPLKVQWSRRLPVDPSSVTVIRKPSGRYFASFVVDVPASIVPKTSKSVGIDFGISRLATLSTGERIANPKHGTRLQKRLALEQRRLTKKQRIKVVGKDGLLHKQDSIRRVRQKRIVARVHERIADARKDTLHKLTTRIVKEFDSIYIEDLNLRGMVKNHSLARSLHDAGIGMAIQMLEVKAASAGKMVRKIDRWFPSSKMCSACGHLLAKLPLGTRSWDCPSCRVHHDRDDNAALNILAVGQTVSAHGDGVRLARVPIRESIRRRSANPLNVSS